MARKNKAEAVKRSTEAGCAPEPWLKPEVEEELELRLRRLSGQLGGIGRMVREHRKCEEIILQLASARAALGEIMGLLLEEHLTTCVAERIRQGKVEEPIREFARALRFAVRNS